MLNKYSICSSLLIIFSITVFSQTKKIYQINNEDDLTTALVGLKTDELSTAIAILKDNPIIVTRALFFKLIPRADLLSNSADTSQSLFIYEIAREAAKQTGDGRLVAYAFYKIGLLNFRRGNISLAKLNYLQSKQVFEQADWPADLSIVLSGLGNVCIYTGDLKEAKDYSLQSIALSNSVGDHSKSIIGPFQYGVAVAWLNLGDLAKGEGSYDEALTYFKKAFEFFKGLSSSLPEYRADVVDSLAEIGRVYRVLGDHQQALNYFNQALIIAKTLNSRDKLASVLNSIGVLYIEQGDYLKASDYISQSLSIYLTIGDRLEIARLLINQGVINQRQAKYDEALKNFQEGLRSAEAINAPDLIITAQEGLGAVNQEQGDYRVALEWLDKALLTAQKVQDRTRSAELLWREGEAYYLKSDIPKALASADSAVDLAGQLRLPIISYLALTAKGKYYLAEKDFDHAFQTLSQAMGQIETMRPQVAGQEEERQIFFENKVAPYNLLVELLINQNKPMDALLYAERAKGRVLFDVLRDGKVDLAAALTLAEREEASRLNRAILVLNERIRNEQTKVSSDATVIKRLYSDLDAARLNFESFQNTLYASNPELNIRRGQTPELNSESFNNLTQDNKTAYLEYVVTREQVFLFVLTKGANARPELKVYPIKIKADDLTYKVNQFHRLVSDRNPVFASSAHELFDLLIKPAAQQLAGVSTLCIIPDASLWDVPFQALLSANDRYLLEDYALYYAPSLSVLQEMSRHTGARQARSSLIAFGNPVIGKVSGSNSQVNNTDQDLCPLPEAETEVSTLAQIYGSANSKAFIGQDASEKTFKQLAPSYRILHLATHGVLDNRHPLYSYLLLTKIEGDLENDGLLEAREIMNMNLHADLAVLSACETARGRVGAGEGVIGMSWAFFVAGVRTTVVSQWKVNSASTSQLMVNFYKALKATNAQNADTKATALRVAAISLMRDQRFRHPFYWAGFVMVGSNE